MGVEPFVDCTRLHANRLGVDAEHAAKMPGEVQHQPRSERPAGRTRSGPSGVYRDLFFGGVLERSRHVGGGSGANHTQRLDLVDAPVAGVQLQEDVVAANLAGHQTPKIGLNPFALLVELVH